MISIIVAISRNNVIGKDAEIPWKIPGEQKRFKELTIGKTVIMGRKTFESIGKPLPNRKTIIVTRNKDYHYEKCLVANSLQQALDLCSNDDEIFIAGGGQIYKEVLPRTDRIYLTIVEKDIEGNIYFPEIDEKNFKETYSEKMSGKIPYTYKTLERIREE